MKILIIRPGALGDTLMLLPAFLQLRKSTEIILAGRSPGLEFINPYIHLSLDFEERGWHQLFLDKIEDPHAVPVPQVDRVVVFLGDHEKRVQNNLRRLFPIASVHIFPASPSQKEKIHVALYLAKCFQEAGLFINPEKSFEEACTRPLFRREISSARGGKIICHPGSGGQKKNHPPDFWIKLIKGLRNSLFPSGPCNCILLLGPAEIQFQPFYQENLRHEEAEIVLCPDKDRLILILKEAPLYIGHDSGITHLSAMLGTPTIALFKDSPIDQWRPLGPEVRVFKNMANLAGLRTRILDHITSRYIISS